MLENLLLGKILIFESSAGWLCHHLGSDNLHSILPSWHLPSLAARQSRHSVKLVNLTSPLTTFAKTMQQHVRLIKKLAQLIRFQSASLPNNYRDPPPPVNLWPVARGGQGAATSPGLSIEVGCLINGRTKHKTLSTTVTCPRAAPCPPVLLPHCCKDETKYLNSRRRSVNSC